MQWRPITVCTVTVQGGRKNGRWLLCVKNVAAVLFTNYQITGVNCSVLCPNWPRVHYTVQTLFSDTPYDAVNKRVLSLASLNSVTVRLGNKFLIVCVKEHPEASGHSYWFSLLLVAFCKLHADTTALIFVACWVITNKYFGLFHKWKIILSYCSCV